MSMWWWSAPASPASTCCTGYASSASACEAFESADRRRRHVVLEPLPRRPVRHPQRSTTRTASTPSSRPSGSGRRSTRRNPRSCATCSTSPTSTTFAATSSSRRESMPLPWDDDASIWRIRTDRGDEVTCRSYVMATGCLSMPKSADVDGTDRFAGDVYFTSRWPHEGVDFTGKRVGVIGTGSSGVQSIPLIAQQAAQLTVFQRTPNFSVPARNGPIPERMLEPLRDQAAEYREAAKWSRGGIPGRADAGDDLHGVRGRATRPLRRGVGSGRAVRDPRCVRRSDGQPGGQRRVRRVPARTRSDRSSTTRRRPRRSARRDHPFGTKRPCLDTNYFATYNLPHVRLVDLRKHPIRAITETGIDTVDESFEFDAIVFATGFDAMTGALVAVDITGRDGVTLKEKWAHGPTTYLGLTTVGFPNFFVITGPGSPSVLSNMAVSIEQHVDWVADCLADLRARHGSTRSSPRRPPRLDGCSTSTTAPTSRSTPPPTRGTWAPTCRASRGCSCRTSAVSTRTGPSATRSSSATTSASACPAPTALSCNDGVIRRAAARRGDGAGADGLARSAADRVDVRRRRSRRSWPSRRRERPPGPDVGEIVDGTLPGAAGDLDYRLYRPADGRPASRRRVLPRRRLGAGRHRLRRSRCAATSACDPMPSSSRSTTATPPRRASPPPIDDGFAAVRGSPTTLSRSAVCRASSPSADGAPAATSPRSCASWHATPEGPTSSGRLLLTPVTDSDMTTESYIENADGYVLTAPLMRWFWDHYADPDDRTDPRASPLLAGDLSGPPAGGHRHRRVRPAPRRRRRVRRGARRGRRARAPHPRLAVTRTRRSRWSTSSSRVRARAEIAESLRQFFGASVPA